MSRVEGWNLKFRDYAADGGSRDVVTALPNDRGMKWHSPPRRKSIFESVNIQGISNWPVINRTVRIFTPIRSGRSSSSSHHLNLVLLCLFGYRFIRCCNSKKLPINIKHPRWNEFITIPILYEYRFKIYLIGIQCNSPCIYTSCSNFF